MGVAALFIASIIVTYSIRVIAVKKSLYDLPNDRSSHTIPTPRVGGLGIALLWYLVVLWSFLFGDFMNNAELILLAVLPVTLISVFDDFMSIKAGVRFLIQCLSVTTGICVMLFYYLSMPLQLHFIIIALLLIPCGVWFINLYNFLDGIDGYAAAQSIVFFLISFYVTENFYLLLFVATVAGFLVFNWHPAKIFMGDTGSTLLGFVIFMLSIIFHFNGAQHLLLSLSFTSLFWMDATVTLIRRLINKENVTQAHRKHAYQRLTQAGLKHSWVTIVLISIYCVLFGAWSLFNGNKNAEIILFIISVLFSCIYLIFAERKKAFTKD